MIGGLITPHFTVNEALTGTKLTAVPAGVQANVQQAADGMEQLRQVLGRVLITPTSWYRDDATNLRVGGSSTSGHKQGYAVDFTVKGMTPNEVMRRLQSHVSQLGIDQLIEYPGHVHVSFDPRRRAQVLAAQAGAFIPWTPGVTIVPMTHEPGTPKKGTAAWWLALIATIATTLAAILSKSSGQ